MSYACVLLGKYSKEPQPIVFVSLACCPICPFIPAVSLRDLRSGLWLGHWRTYLCSPFEPLGCHSGCTLWILALLTDEPPFPRVIFWQWGTGFSPGILCTVSLYLSPCLIGVLPLPALCWCGATWLWWRVPLVPWGHSLPAKTSLFGLLRPVCSASYTASSGLILKTYFGEGHLLATLPFCGMVLETIDAFDLPNSEFSLTSLGSCRALLFFIGVQGEQPFPSWTVFFSLFSALPPAHKGADCLWFFTLSVPKCDVIWGGGVHLHM